MTLEQILHEDKIAVPVWATFTLAAAVRPFITSDLHSTVQTFISIIPALCGAYLGYRHMQSIQAFKLEKIRADLEKMHAEHSLEREKLAVSRCTRCDSVSTGEINIMTNPVKAAGNDEPTVDLK